MGSVAFNDGGSSDARPDSETPASVIAFAPKKGSPDVTMVADDAGHGIVALVQKAADLAKADCDRAMRILPTGFLPSCRQPRKEHANLRQRQIIFGTVPLMPKNGWFAFTLKSSRRSFKGNSNNAPCGRVSETGAFSVRSALIIGERVRTNHRRDFGVWTVSVSDCPSGGA